MAPAISAGFAATIFMLIKLIVHMRRNPVPWAIYTSPFFFLIAGTVCTLSIVYKGSPNLGLNKKPSWYIAAVTLGVGGALFFVPYVHARVLKRDQTVKWWHFIMGPALLKRPVVLEGDHAKVPNYAVVQDDDVDSVSYTGKSSDSETGDAITAVENEKALVAAETEQKTHKQLVAEGEERLHKKLRQKKGPIGWAMRTLHNNPMGPGQIYEWHNVKIIGKRIPAMLVVGLLYGVHYDIHAAQTGIAGTPDGERMKRVYAAAEKYPNEVEHTYSFVQILTACTASFAHGANDIGNSVGPWAVIYSAWNTGNAAASKAPVPVWQLAVLSATISLGLCTYGYNIMKGKSSSTTPP
jgi:sodium-dependent phosphate transporter